MHVTSLVTNVTSDNAEKLTEFYRDVVGLEMAPNSGGFRCGTESLFIVDGHSETRGPAKEPARVLISFFVDDAAAETARLEAAGVPCIRNLGREEWGGVFSTFVDPDGNYFQVAEYHPPS